MKYVRRLGSPLTAWLLDRPALRRALAGLVVLGAVAWLAVGPPSAAAQATPIVKFYTGPLPYLEMPPEVSPGHDFTFTLTFENKGTGLGYGSYIDLLLPTIGIDDESAGGPCDGIWFVSAEAVFTSPAAFPLTTVPATGSGHTIFPTTVVTPAGTSFPMSCTKPVSQAHIGLPVSPLPAFPLAHPFGGTFPPPGSTPPEGYELVVIKLPGGSYDPGQGITYVNVTAHVSDHADANKPLTIFARGGFRFRDNPLGTGSPPPIEQSNFDQRPTTPVPFTISKICSLTSSVPYVPCPEDETATGPNFSMNYVITVDIDDGLTIKNLTVDDILPDNVQYDDHLKVTVPGLLAPLPREPLDLFTANSPPCKNQPPTTNLLPPVAVSEPGTSPGGTLQATLCGSVTGTTAPDDVVISFQFHVPALDSGDYPILDTSCSPALAINDIKATGEWDPIIDFRDPQPTAVVSDTTPVDHTLLKKCIAIQKTAAPAVVIPGDTITYTLNFQFSDYMQMNNLVVTDLLSDGQTFNPITATLTVADKTGSFSIPAGSLTPFITTVSPVCDPATPWPGPPQIGTRIIINISAALIGAPPPTLSLGILTGAFIPPPPYPPNPLAIGATGQITFQTQVQDEFDCPVPGDTWVDKFDRLYDHVTIRGDVIQRADGVLPPFPTTEDDSGAVVPVAGDSIKKCIYSIERPAGTFVPGFGPPVAPDDCAVQPNGTPPQITPGDKVTFRILKTIPSGDWEKLDITDFLPHPVLKPAPSTWGLGPSTPACLPTPSVTTTVSAASNSIAWGYGSGNDPNNLPCVIDILLEVTVTGAPYADGLLFTNEAIECEYNSFNEKICQTAIAPMELTEPRLSITKGVVAACQLNPAGNCVSPPPPLGTFNPLPVGPVAFSPPGSLGVRFTPPLVNSLGLAANPINSNVIGNVDASDIVTFAVVVKNYGKGLNGAFDVKINDTLPSSFMMPLTSSGYNFSVTDGRGLPFTCNPAPCGSPAFATAFFGPGITLDDPGPTPSPTGGLDPYSANLGTNILVITYDLQVRPTVIVGSCFTNTARIKNYAGIEGGPNHTVTPYGGPYSDTAQVCINPSITKSIFATSEAHTGLVSGVEELAIGEIARYRLDIVLPEGQAASFQVNDVLPAGLLYISGATTTLSVTNTGPTNTGTFGTPLPTMTVMGPFNCGAGPVFDFGALTNPDRDPDQEIIHIEFNALVCNILGNQYPVAQDNYAQVSFGRVVVKSNTVKAKIVEPEVTITKHIDSQVQVTGQVFVTYKVTLASTGSADAFDVHMTDVLPQGCQFVVGSLTWIASPPIWWWAGISPPGSFPVTIVQFPKTETLDIYFTAQCSSITTACDNHADVDWTSLPGPKGTTANLTGSSTPGLSGAINGERDGSGGLLGSGALNDYKASTGTTGPPCGPCAPVPAGLQAWWPLDEKATATKIRDVRDGHTGTAKPVKVDVSGGIGIGVGPVTNNAPNISPPFKVRGSLDFPDSTTFVQVPTSPALAPGNGLTDGFTIDAWVYPRTPAPNVLPVMPIVDKWDPSYDPQGTTIPSQVGYAFYIQNGLLKFQYSDGGTIFTDPSNATVLYDQWSHVAVTFQRDGGGGSVVKLYINGLQWGQQNVPAIGAITNGKDLLIGGTRLLQLPLAEIALDEVEIFGVAVPQLDTTTTPPSGIQPIYEAGSAGKCRSVGGVVAFMVSDSALMVSDSASSFPSMPLAAIAAGVMAVMGAGLWYGRRRWLR